MRIKWAFIVALIAALTACSKPPESAVVNIRMAVGGQAQFIYLPLTLANQLGYFRDEGLNVTISDLKGGSEALAALLGQSVDMVTGFYEHTIRTQVQGKRLQMIVLFDRFPGMVLMVGKSHVAQVHSIKDLAGHPVGITAPGSSTDEMLKMILKGNGLRADDVPVVTAGTTTMVAALEQDRVWAGITVDPLATKLQKDGTAFPIYDTRTEQGTKDVFGGPWPAGGIYASMDFIEKNPETVRKITRAAIRTLEYIQNHSAEDIAAQMPESFLAGGRDQYVESLKANLAMFSGDGTMPSEGPANVLKTLGLLDANISESAVDLKVTFRNYH